MRPVLRAPRSPRRAVSAAIAALLATVAVGCAPQPEEDASGPASASGASCAKGELSTQTSGKLTIATDEPAYEPWFRDDDPKNGEGFESAVAYAVAKELGYAEADVVWQSVPFNKAFAPGAKTFDFDINQVSISDERKKAVDFSSGYYDVRQAVVALKGSAAAKATNIADLRKLHLGAQVGTTSLDYIDDVVKPTQDAAAYAKNDQAKSALKNGQIDAIVVDLPTAFYITSAEVTDAKIVGQFENQGGTPEQFGLVLDRGSALTSCVTTAVDALREDGTLAKIEQEWLSDAVDAPVLK
ncbi:ABC transporter substrate-binding protein [Streptomyces europaeiscabiei]|uniref:ABC transporter substrate-binding protein n=1 Tax=Streptomyces europaeiscabiei TaxID=146819 RepID=UPI0029A4B964|nr:ABC transporter substrate-binding protein [Streptomyces europaeiscabiei]MDX2529571.1 ABC transporter substrate-binding protein [Streptomyces europaeiscabiei]MDX2768104.1 ABC transporter substrate-binding protein [Streptomyces europaeiscabiei]MDX3669374.1 ABC transporter substrate-binding protein [Streptomyces europaeiscabiei]MDX3709514.1 ABC transporter substrate-binding protein [Streptomyces europaeiscabiei]MDX3778676.1 ABC transporter substrate-binding protein [Streptomyces europaeiscabie